ncbi:GntR family transcriptional regulator [Bacillus sp. REN16]|uniref:GntR family transcriptional regulator n=1 Tax=Bacillus sp. REN16 TaxID=2887296 RepID=UPI001E44D7DC|nr:GntR family transcriptional regulator [Bacillus sp. REN16]MCC3356148.1 GntR family transcriptional regulator [Bacillus sp. REN16]
MELITDLQGTSLGEKIAYDLRLEIINGAIKNGETLSENQIASKFGTSRSPVREALKILQHEGLIRLERMGAVVHGLTPKSMSELYDVRILIENFAIAKLLAGNCQATVQKLNVIIDKMEMATKHGNYEEFAYYDLQFHETIIVDTGHERILHLWNSIRQIVYAAMLVATEKRFSMNAHEVEPLLNQHRELVQYLSSKDKQHIEKILNEHFEDMIDSVEKSISKGQ